MFARTVYALGQTQSAAGAPAGGAYSAILQLIPLVLIFAVFYFLVIRPQQQKQKQHEELLNNIKKGDKVVTLGGILGTVVGVKDNNTISIEIASGVRIDVLKKAISSLQQGDAVVTKE
ncbi:preprotein translocase subunit YajC [Candidatus Poribacteria bacterium]|nr:preprotein translocase subunit YajC [Candidatus Poribacteria bacterium]